MENKSVFETLSAVNVNDKIEKKNGLSYLSWAFAWDECKKAYPNAFYTIYENDKGWNYFTDEKTCWVKTGVTIEGLEHIEYLPIMDFRNKSIRAEDVTSFDVNKTIQRSLTKALARHGLGLYIYAGEDLPEQVEEPPKKISKEQLDGLVAVLSSSGFEGERIIKMLKYYKVDKIYNLDEKQYADLLTKIKKEQKK